MKKYLSLLLVAAMCLSLVIVSAVSVNAVNEGEWNVFARRGLYEDAESYDTIPAPGYEYTADGLHMIPTDWTNSRAWGICQTKDQIDLRQGVYMEVRVDDFKYEGDKWFGFNVWEERIDEFPNVEDTQPLGVEVLMRPNESKEIASLQLNSHTKVGESIETAGASASGFQNKLDENGCPILTLRITWNEAEGYTMIVNGMELNSSFSNTMTKFFDGEDNDGLAYISFSLQTGASNASVECTVLKFGTSPDNCSTPMGSDRSDPVSNKIEIAEIADPDTVPLGEPAIFLNGSTVNSHLLSKPKSTNNSTITIKNDNSVNVMTTTTWASVSMSVAYDISYDIADFPIMLIITRNMCTCVLTEQSPMCSCFETPTVFAMAGDIIAESNDYTIKAVSYMFEPYVDDEGNAYVYYFADWYEYSGRINGFRIDLQGVKNTEEGRNSFDICNVAFFRDYDEAEAYFNEYLIEIGAMDDEEESTESSTEVSTETESDTERPTETVTEAVTEKQTETVTEKYEETDGEDTKVTETEPVTAPESETVVETQPETEPTDNDEINTEDQENSGGVTEEETRDDENATESVTSEEKNDTESNKNEQDTEPKDSNETEPVNISFGCGGSISVGAIAIIVAAAAAVCLKKRED